MLKFKENEVFYDRPHKSVSTLLNKPNVPERIFTLPLTSYMIG